METQNNHSDNRFFHYFQFLKGDPAMKAHLTAPFDNDTNLAELNIKNPSTQAVAKLLTSYEYALALSLSGVTLDEVSEYRIYIEALLKRYTGVVTKLNNIDALPLKTRIKAQHRLTDIETYLLPLLEQSS